MHLPYPLTVYVYWHDCSLLYIGNYCSHWQSPFPPESTDVVKMVKESTCVCDPTFPWCKLYARIFRGIAPKTIVLKRTLGYQDNYQVTVVSSDDCDNVTLSILLFEADVVFVSMRYFKSIARSTLWIVLHRVFHAYFPWITATNLNSLDFKAFDLEAHRHSGQRPSPI